MMKICKTCGKKKIQAKGMCGACYAKDYRKRFPNSCKDYYERNRVKINVESRKYYKEHKEEMRQKQNEARRKLYHNNKEVRDRIKFRKKTCHLISLKDKKCSNCGSTNNCIDII